MTFLQRLATVTISPKVMRGKWDGGLILELGTRPIPNVPWMPIKRWADFRGVPAGPVTVRVFFNGLAEQELALTVAAGQTASRDISERLGCTNFPGGPQAA